MIYVELMLLYIFNMNRICDGKFLFIIPMSDFKLFILFQDLTITTAFKPLHMWVHRRLEMLIQIQDFLLIIMVINRHSVDTILDMLLHHMDMLLHHMDMLHLIMHQIIM